MQLFQGRKQSLDGVSQLDGGRGIGQQRSAGDQEHDADHHKHGGLDAPLGNVDKLPGKQHRSLVDEQQVQQGCEDQNGNDGLDAFDKHLCRDPGQGDGKQAEHASHCQSQRLLGHKQHDDEQGGKDDLEPGIQPVDHTFSGKVLPQGNVLQHVPSPPFSFRCRNSISFAYATVYTWLSNR